MVLQVAAGVIIGGGVLGLIAVGLYLGSKGDQRTGCAVVLVGAVIAIGIVSMVF